MTVRWRRPSVQIQKTASTIGSFRFGAGEDFLKPRLSAQRVPLPTLPEIGQGDAFGGVIDRKRSGQKTFDLADCLILLTHIGADQSKKGFNDRAFNDVAGDGLDLHSAAALPERVFLAAEKCVEQAELRPPGGSL